MHIELLPCLATTNLPGCQVVANLACKVRKFCVLVFAIMTEGCGFRAGQATASHWLCSQKRHPGRG